MRQHHGHTSGLGGHRSDHVLDPGEVAGGGRRQPGKIPAVGVLHPHIVAPLF